MRALIIITFYLCYLDPVVWLNFTAIVKGIYVDAFVCVIIFTNVSKLLCSFVP